MADRTRVTPIDPEPNQYAGFVAPKRADESTVTYYGDSGGNTVDQSQIPRTLDRVGREKSSIKPGGTASGSGY